MSHKYAIGIGLNLFDARAILLRDDSKVIIEIEKDRKNITANETLQILFELFDQIISKSTKYKNDIRGIGLALGGIVDNKKGLVHWPQRQDSSFTYISIPLKEHLEKKIDLPIVLENDANASALAEKIINFTDHKNLIYMFSGVGCGIIIDGKLYKGKDGGAGELFINYNKSTTSLCGDFSFLQPWPADLNIVKRAKELISLGKETSLIKKISPTGELSLLDIFSEANKKDKLSKAVLKEAAFCLGVKIAFLVNLLNPEIVIIGGGLEEAGDFFLEECIDAIKNFSFSEMRHNLKIIFSNLGKKATSLGAALSVLKSLE